MLNIVTVLYRYNPVAKYRAINSTINTTGETIATYGIISVHLKFIPQIDKAPDTYFKWDIYMMDLV